MAIVQQQRQRQYASLFHTISCYVVMVVVLLCLSSSSSSLVVSAVDATSTSSSSSTLRGQQQDDSNSSNNKTLKERAMNPFIRDDIRGKTLSELGVVTKSTTTTKAATTTTSTTLEQAKSQSQDRRRTQQKVKLNYFAIYDEFGPFFVSMGDTAGLRGNIYNLQAQKDGLNPEFVEGALQGTCSVVATSGKQLCSYEFFLLDIETGIMATIVATGSVLMEVDKSNLLIIEATGDDFVNYNGGMVTLEYTSIGGQTVMNLDITLDRR